MFLLKLFRGFRWNEKQKDFDDAYTKPNRRKNQHIVLYKGSWCVHPEGDTKIERFADKESAIKHARDQAQELRTEALLHKEDGSVETSWIYSPDAFPQRKVHAPQAYPIEDHPGEHVL